MQSIRTRQFGKWDFSFSPLTQWCACAHTDWDRKRAKRPTMRYECMRCYAIPSRRFAVLGCHYSHLYMIFVVPLHIWNGRLNGFLPTRFSAVRISVVTACPYWCFWAENLISYKGFMKDFSFTMDFQKKNPNPRSLWHEIGIFKEIFWNKLALPTSLSLGIGIPKNLFNWNSHSKEAIHMKLAFSKGIWHFQEVFGMQLSFSRSFWHGIGFSKIFLKQNW